MTQNPEAIKEKIEESKYIKMKSLFFMEGPLKGLKDKRKIGENISIPYYIQKSNLPNI